MEIKEILTINDKVDNQVDMLNRTGLNKNKIRNRKFMYFIIIILCVFIFFYSVFKDISILFVLSILYSIWGLIELIFAKKRYLYLIRKNIKKNLELITKQYGIDNDKIESITKIEGNDIIIRENNTVIIFSKLDFIKDFENERSYILEFTKGRFMYFKKDTFESKQKYLEFLKEINQSVNV